MTLLALLPDAYGADGGIAKVNRDLLAALAEHPAVSRVDVLARVPASGDADVPAGVSVDASASGSAAAYLRALTTAVRRGGYDGVLCGHLHLAPLAAMAAALRRVPFLLVVHGIEAWGPPHWPATRGRLATAVLGAAARRARRVVAVSALTRGRFAARFGVPEARVAVVPNGVDLSAFGPGTPRPDLVARYGLAGKTVLMTLARLSPDERYKGIDETIAALPALAEHVPDVAYLVCGGGSDRARLEAVAQQHGVADRVVFAGYVPEEDKADHYRLADAFVMPGRGEGFGIVYLEALACGIPAVASALDASREAVRDGLLGGVVDPDHQAALVSGIRDALARQKGVPAGLDHFSQARFADRWHAVIDSVFDSSQASVQSDSTPVSST